MKRADRLPDKSAPFLALAALCWGLAGGIGGLLMENGWEALVVAFYRGAIGLVFVLAWLVCRPQGSGLNDRWLWLWASVAGLAVAGNFSFYFLSISEGSVAVAASLMYCAPIYVYLVSFALNLERPTPAKWAGIAFVMLGVVLLTRVYDIESGNITTLGVIAGLLSGVCYAVFIFGFKKAAPHGSPQATLAVAFSVLAMILFFIGDLSQSQSVLATPDWMLFAALGVLGAGISFYLYVIGIEGTAPTMAAILAMIEPVTASIFGMAVMGDHLELLQLLGMVMILVTVTALGADSKPDLALTKRFYRGKWRHYLSPRLLFLTAGKDKEGTGNGNDQPRRRRRLLRTS